MTRIVTRKQDSSEYVTVDRDLWLHRYRQMFKIRAFEEQMNDLYLSARMPGLAHLYIGEEPVAVGVCEALTREGYITSTYRGHGHCLAKGAAIDRVFAELLGKEADCCRGKGGTMHIADPETGNLGEFNRRRRPWYRHWGTNQCVGKCDGAEDVGIEPRRQRSLSQAEAQQFPWRKVDWN